MVLDVASLIIIPADLLFLATLLSTITVALDGSATTFDMTKFNKLIFCEMIENRFPQL